MTCFDSGNNSSDERPIPGASEYGIDPTVFDPLSIDMNSLDPIKDSQVIAYMLAGAAGEECDGADPGIEWPGEGLCDGENADSGCGGDSGCDVDGGDSG